jgi:hypothetical protein
MRRWLRDPPAETARTAETPARPLLRVVSAVSAISATPPKGSSPDQWVDALRHGDLPGLTVERWLEAADNLEGLIESDVVEAALIRGWHPLELIGVRHAKPHDHPSSSGLIFSIHRGYAVEAISDIGCAIVPAGTNVRHLWRRAPLPTDGSVCLPWELQA